jgi:hypothetical protein
MDYPRKERRIILKMYIKEVGYEGVDWINLVISRKHS